MIWTEGGVGVVVDSERTMVCLLGQKANQIKLEKQKKISEEKKKRNCRKNKIKFGRSRAWLVQSLLVFGLFFFLFFLVIYLKFKS